MNSSRPGRMSTAARSQLSTPAIAGIVFLAVQLFVAINHSAADPRWVHFTPYSGETAYRLNVTVGGRALTDTQVRRRYGVPFRGHTGLTPAALQQVIIARERSAGAGRETFVRMHTSWQGGPEEVWLWPQR